MSLRTYLSASRDANEQEHNGINSWRSSPFPGKTLTSHTSFILVWKYVLMKALPRTGAIEGFKMWQKKKKKEPYVCSSPLYLFIFKL